MEDLAKTITAIAEQSPTPLTRSEWKKIVREALREEIKHWLEQKAQELGKWTFKWIATAVGALLLWFAATHGLIKSGG